MLAIIVAVIIFVTFNQCEAKRMIRCPKWRHHYLDFPIKGKPKCKPCTLCKPGFRQVTHCTKVDDTHCEPCRWGTYSSNNSKRCRPCKHCWQGGTIRRKCTSIEKAQCECSKGKYYKNGKCIPCIKCLPGTYMMSECSLLENTQCRKCPEGTYTSTRSSHTSRYCPQCSDCRLGELILQTCNSTHDTVCGECRPGLFRRSSSHECAPCAPCYPDVNGSYASAIIIEECRRRNPDQSRICMPVVTTLPVDVSNNTELTNTTISAVADISRMKKHAQMKFFEGDDGGLALFITACTVIAVICLMLFSLCLVYIHKHAGGCGRIGAKHQNTNQHGNTKDLLAEYLVDQRSSRPDTLTRANSAIVPCTKINSQSSRATTVSLETGTQFYLPEKGFSTPVTWTFGSPSSSSSLEILSVSATGTLSSNKGENNNQNDKKY